MLMTPPGTSLVSKTWYRSPAIRGYAAEGTATTQLPAATKGSTIDRKPNSGADSGQTTPTVPSASFIAREMFLNGGEGTVPSYLSAHASDENNRSTLSFNSLDACLLPTAAAMRVTISCA